jgi:hypothetical protein
MFAGHVAVFVFVGSYKQAMPEMLFKTSACRIDRVISWFCRLGAAGLRCV